MDINLYTEILGVIQSHTGLMKNCTSILQAKFPDIPPGTLASILSHEYQRITKQLNHKHPAIYENVYKQYMQSRENGIRGNLLQIAINHKVAPTLVAKVVLKQFYDELCEKEGENSMKRSKRNFNTMLRDTTLIEDKNLAYDVFLCTLFDNQYSPINDTIRHSLGQQYEIKLYRRLTELGMAFKDEENLRKYGYDKTPDIKLEVPIAIDGFIINWIESKALFGDNLTHMGYMKDQYLSYWNRFGPGLVIYWFGYLETIKDSSDKRFTVMDHFPDPETITSLNCGE